MKVLVLLFVLLGVFPQLGVAQSVGYTTAYATLQAMLTGKQQIDFTHAVFVVENAWYAQPQPEAPFTQQLVSIAQTCQRMVQQKNLQQHRTAGNWALFMWLSQKVPENNQQPFRYNFEDFTGKVDFSHTFVTRALQDHTGTCLSLPLLYKCLAQRMGIEARLTIGPSHAWIRHVDEEGHWTNVELTSGQLPSDGLMITELGIPTEAIKSGAYFKALTEPEAIAFLATQLALSYENKYHRLDSFTDRCADLSLAYYRPNVIAYMLKSNRLVQQTKTQLAKPQPNRVELDRMHQRYLAYQTKLRTLGANTLPTQTYAHWVHSMQARPAK